MHINVQNRKVQMYILSGSLEINLKECLGTDKISTYSEPFQSKLAKNHCLGWSPILFLALEWWILVAKHKVSIIETHDWHRRLFLGCGSVGYLWVVVALDSRI